MLPPNERDLMDLCVFELFPTERPEALRTLDDLTASDWDEHPGEPYLPGSFVKHAPADLDHDDDLVRWR
jgi:hypothetical protein